jgi:hypothetical protein
MDERHRVAVGPSCRRNARRDAVLSITRNEKSPGAIAPGLSTYCNSTVSRGAGDRARTGDVQLGKLAFYQLNYARVSLT